MSIMDHTFPTVLNYSAIFSNFISLGAMLALATTTANAVGSANYQSKIILSNMHAKKLDNIQLEYPEIINKYILGPLLSQ